MHIDGDTALLGLIGDPVAHSYSPYLHNSVLQHLGINAVYIPLHVPQTSIKEAVMAVRALSFKGVNVTIPYKEQVLPYLDAIEGDARGCGAVNVIANQKGRLVGHNTDGQGFLASLRENGVQMQGEAVLIGAGGAARSVGYALAQSGYESIHVFDTLYHRACHLADFLRQNGPGRSVAYLMDNTQFSQVACKADLLVNCSPVGMHPHVDSSPVDNLSFLPESAVLCDLIYNPPLTKFLALGRERGLKVINGMTMFIHQAALTMEILLGIKPPVEYMREVMAHQTP